MKTTTDHKEIRNWVEIYNGQPAAVADPSIESAQVGLRIDFPGHTDDAELTRARNSQTISWESFFRIFEDKKLVFEYKTEPDSLDMEDSYHFANRQTPQMEVEGVINPDEVDDVIRDGLPKYYSHAGEMDNPQQGEIEPVTTDDVSGEEGLGGDTPDLESDDDTTQAAKNAGLLDREEK